MTEKQLSEERLRRLKLQVLNDHRDFLCRELGDPARYLPYLRSKRVLDDSSAERIKSKATPSEKVGELINTLIDSGDGHPLDVLIEGIKRQKVQLHISRVLLKAVNKLIKDQSPHCARSNPPNSDYNMSCSQESTGSHEFQPGKPDGYECHPEYGPLPNPPPAALKVEDNTSASDHSNSDNDVHPEYGPLPSLPPVTAAGYSSNPTISLEQQQTAIPSHGPLYYSSPLNRTPLISSGSTPVTPSIMRGPAGGQEVPQPYPSCLHRDDSEYYRAQLDQKDVDIRNLQSQLKMAREENEKLRGRIDTLEKEITLTKQGRGGVAPRPSHLPFSRSPDGHHASSLGQKSGRDQPLWHSPAQPHQKVQPPSSVPTPILKTTPLHSNVALDSGSQPRKLLTPNAASVTLKPAVNECTTDV